MMVVSLFLKVIKFQVTQLVNLLSRKSYDFNQAEVEFINLILYKSSKNQIKLFSAESERKKLIAEVIARYNQDWKKIGKCFFPLCPKQAISNSHSLSDKLMIDPIAEKRSVMTPKGNPFVEKYEMIKISATKASIFPGFCVKHEQSFLFEKTGKISNGKELQMQLFRSICRHVFFLSNQIIGWEYYLKKMKLLLDKYLDKEIKDYSSPIKHPKKITQYLFQEMQKQHKLILYQRRKDFCFTYFKWYLPNAFGFGKLVGNIYCDELIQVAQKQPFTMSGPILFEGYEMDEFGTPNFNHMFYLNLFPNDGKTLIHLTALKSQKNRLIKLAEHLTNGETARDFYIKWLVKSTEHWFMSPSCWEKFGKQKQEKILNDMK